jgi:hypothetical protein
MTFKQHLERAMKEREQIENRRQTTRETRQVLLPLSNSEQIRHLVREICADGPDRHVE